VTSPTRPVGPPVAQGLDVPALLRGRGLRVTIPRVAVYDAVRLHPHADAEAVATAVRAAVGSVSTQAVYDVHSSEAARDPRGFAVEFRTEEGNWDATGTSSATTSPSSSSVTPSSSRTSSTR
jgi:hypothetical protein